MNVNQIINMVMRIIMRRILGRGIDAGIKMATRRGGSKQDHDLAPEQREPARMAQKTARKARQADKLTRRMGRL
ncbi:MAG: hypothetical protein ACU0DI_11520 [Paracoccaceae bacterium]